MKNFYKMCWNKFGITYIYYLNRCTGQKLFKIGLSHVVTLLLIILRLKNKLLGLFRNVMQAARRSQLDLCSFPTAVSFEDCVHLGNRKRSARTRLVLGAARESWCHSRSGSRWPRKAAARFIAMLKLPTRENACYMLTFLFPLFSSFT